MESKPYYTSHARQRMALRQITETEVEAVLREYDTEYPGRGSTRILIGGVGERRIKLVVAERNGRPVIITVAGRGESV